VTQDDFIIRQMTPADLELALDWAAAEGWNPGLTDAIAFHQTDAQGFLMGHIGDQPVGSIAAVRYGDRYGFLGIYIVQPQWRGRGYGMQLWQAGLQILGDRTLALDGVLAQVDNYQTFGFKTAHHHIRYEGLGEAYAKQVGVVPLRDIPFTTLLDYDTQHFLDRRPTFLQAWIGLNEGYAFLEHGQLLGYGVIRATRRGFKLGPLFADRPAIAQALFQALLTHAIGQPVFLDCPDANPAAIALAETHNMKPMFTCARMYTQAPPPLPLSKIFGVTTLELG
jgi:GNAT superfamily N-acetyltransferase